eukprot:606386-Pyramimonas_sp.AAC.1
MGPQTVYTQTRIPSYTKGPVQNRRSKDLDSLAREQCHAGSAMLRFLTKVPVPPGERGND